MYVGNILLLSLSIYWAVCYECLCFLPRPSLKRGRYTHFKIMAFDYESYLGASGILSIAIATAIESVKGRILKMKIYSSCPHMGKLNLPGRERRSIPIQRLISSENVPL